ncbi:MAG TPA: ATP-binding cassette domain-containing protein [Ilumatobacteraceae bacterium]|jgi:ABC-2 type transport system ATP-binding protein
MTTLSFHQLTKSYGRVVAVDDFTAVAQPGRITAFLGANGSGKTTSMRLLLGLAEPTSGSARIDGRLYRDLEHPLRAVGAVLDQGFHPNRTARNHLRIVAAQAGIGHETDRIDELLDLFDLVGAANRTVGGFSLGMRQRLALASALVGSPGALVLDEPFNGLDPDGIRMMRSQLRSFADAGGTVFLSSHLLAEVAHSADELIVIHRGRLVTAGPVDHIVREGEDLETTFHNLIHPNNENHGVQR